MSRGSIQQHHSIAEELKRELHMNERSYDLSTHGVTGSSVCFIGCILAFACLPECQLRQASVIMVVYSL